MKFSWPIWLKTKREKQIIDPKAFGKIQDGDFYEALRRNSYLSKTSPNIISTFFWTPYLDIKQTTK